LLFTPISSNVLTLLSFKKNKKNIPMSDVGRCRFFQMGVSPLVMVKTSHILNKNCKQIRNKYIKVGKMNLFSCQNHKIPQLQKAKPKMILPF
jgi:hypothetical protein